MTCLFLVKGSPLDPIFNKVNILLTISTHTSDPTRNRLARKILQKYPYANTTSLRNSLEDENTRQHSHRETPGKTLVFTPTEYDGLYQPTIATMITQFNDSSNNPSTEEYNSLHPHLNYQHNLLRNDAEKRHCDFIMCLLDIHDHIERHIHHDLPPINTIIFPYLIGCPNLKEWNTKYLPQIKHFSQQCYEKFKIRTLITISKTVSELITENKEFDYMCNFTESFSDLPLCDTYSSYKSISNWEDHLIKIKQNNQESTLENHFQFRRQGDDKKLKNEQQRRTTNKNHSST